MINMKIKCSSIKHKESIDADIYCPQCKIYMCAKCQNYHSELFQSHYLYKINKDMDLMFPGFCKVENHLNKLDYFCKTHNQLCCVACICMIKDNNNGQHRDCNFVVLKRLRKKKKIICKKILFI